MTGTPTTNWGFPTYDGTEPGSLKTIGNAISNASEAALNSASATFFLRFDTLAHLNSAAGPFGNNQHATVYADSTAINNGDYLYNGTAWVLYAQDTGWVPLVTASGVTLAGGNARILNQVLYLQGSASRTANWTAGQNVATLPATLRSLVTATGQKIVSFGSGNLGVINIAAGTGTISLSIASGTTSLTMSLNIGSPVN